MMAISAIYMGHKVIMDPAADCPASHVAEIIVALRRHRYSSSVGDLVMFSYEFKNVVLAALMLSKEGQLHKEQIYFAFLKIGF